MSLGSVGNRIITSVPGLVGSSSNKPVVVNAAQLGSGRHQVVSFKPKPWMNFKPKLKFLGKLFKLRVFSIYTIHIQSVKYSTYIGLDHWCCNHLQSILTKWNKCSPLLWKKYMLLSNGIWNLGLLKIYYDAIEKPECNLLLWTTLVITADSDQGDNNQPGRWRDGESGWSAAGETGQ